MLLNNSSKNKTDGASQSDSLESGASEGLSNQTDDAEQIDLSITETVIAVAGPEVLTTRNAAGKTLLMKVRVISFCVVV